MKPSVSSIDYHNDANEEERNEKTSRGLQFSKVVELLPRTERTKAMLAKKQEIEELVKAKKTARLKEQQQREVEKRLKEQEEKKMLQEKCKILEEEERKRKEEQEHRSRLDGGLDTIINNFKNDNNLEYVSLNGLSLGPVRLRLLIRDGIASNRTLTALDLSRRGLSDEDGLVVCGILETSNTLLKLELQGNILGVRTANAIAIALQVNKNLRSLTLDNNNLTNGGTDQSPIIAMAESLKHNRHLSVLSLANNLINGEAGTALTKAVEVNHTLTHLDLTQNHIPFTESRELHRHLSRNRDELSKLLKQQQLEQQLMESEEKFQCIHDMQLESRRIQIEGTQKRQIGRMQARLEEWRVQKEEEIAAEQAEIQQLAQEYEDRKKLRAKRGKRKGRKK